MKNKLMGFLKQLKYQKFAKAQGLYIITRFVLLSHDKVVPVLVESKG